MKPITLTPAQMDAALGLEAHPLPRTLAGRLETLTQWLEGVPLRDADGNLTGERSAPLITREQFIRLADVPRLECTCAGRDGLCPNCRVSP